MSVTRSRQSKLPTILGTILGAICALIFAAASSPAMETESAPLKEEFHQSYPLSGNGRITLDNLNGPVHISAWERNEVKVDAIKRAYRKDRLQEATIRVDAQPDSIHIKTEYPEENHTFSFGKCEDDQGEPCLQHNPASVEYTLIIPRNAQLDQVKLINGALDITGVAGPVRASSVNGRVTARGLSNETQLSTINNRLEVTYDTMPSCQARLHSVNGTLILVIPSDAAVEVHARTVTGSISNDFGLPVQDGRYVGHDLAGRLGNGGAHIELKNVNGSITVKHASDGKPLSAATSLLPLDRSRLY